MRARKQKMVFSADPQQILELRKLIRGRKYQTPSEFLREAIEEKLERIRRERLEEQVQKFCEREAKTDLDLIDHFQSEPDDE